MSYGTKNSVRTIALVVALLFLIAAVSYLIGRCITGTWDIRHWLDKEPEQTEKLEPDVSDGGNLAVTPGTQSIMRLSVQSDDGIDTQSDTTYTITATVKDDNDEAVDVLQSVTWSMDWVTEQSIDVDDYVNMIVNGCTVSFSLKQPFSTQILVTCMSNVNTSVKATATIDYVKRVQGWTSDDGYAYTFQNENDHSVIRLPFTETDEILLFNGIVYGATGTMIDTIESGRVKITPTDDCVAAVNAAANGFSIYSGSSFDWLVGNYNREYEGTTAYGSCDPLSLSEFIGRSFDCDWTGSSIGPLMSFARQVALSGSLAFEFDLHIELQHGSNYDVNFTFFLIYDVNAASVTLDNTSIIM